MDVVFKRCPDIARCVIVLHELITRVVFKYPHVTQCARLPDYVVDSNMSAGHCTQLITRDWMRLNENCIIYGQNTKTHNPCGSCFQIERTRCVLMNTWWEHIGMTRMRVGDASDVDLQYRYQVQCRNKEIGSVGRNRTCHHCFMTKHPRIDGEPGSVASVHMFCDILKPSKNRQNVGMTLAVTIMPRRCERQHTDV